MHLKFIIFGYFKEIAFLAAEIFAALSETIASNFFDPIFWIISSILFVKNSENETIRKDNTRQTGKII